MIRQPLMTQTMAGNAPGGAKGSTGGRRASPGRGPSRATRASHALGSRRATASGAVPATPELRQVARRLPRLELTRRGWGLLAVSLLLVMSWYLLRLRLLTDAASLMAAPVVVGLMAAAALAVVNAVRRPRVRLTASRQPQAGQRLWVSIKVRCLLPAFLPAWVAWQVGPERSGRALTPLDAGRSALGMTAQRRGPEAVMARWIVVAEPLGLARARIPLGASTEVLVLPRPAELPEPLPAPRACDLPGGRLGDQGEERLASLREYRPGDALGSIHWRQSARIDQLLVVEREHEALPHPSLALVVEPGAYRGPEHLEAAISLAAGVVGQWARQRLGADLLLLARRPGQGAWAALRFGTEQAEAGRLLQVLARLEPGAPGGLGAMEAVADHEPRLSLESVALPRYARADVVITASPRGGGQAVFPPLDPGARGVLVVAGAGRVQATGAPDTWRVLAVADRQEQ